jgi:hypothetical protein
VERPVERLQHVRAPSPAELAPIKASKAALRDNWIWILIALAGLSALIAALLTRG